VSLEVAVSTRIGEFHLSAAFVLPPGLTVLFGPSGSGKTRLLRMIAGLDRPSQGRITLERTVFDDVAHRVHLAPHERQIGMVFQQPYLLPHRTAAANVALAARSTRAEGARPARLTPAAANGRALTLLEEVGAAQLAALRPHQLSGGQRQRVALARALAGRPRLLLLDEPFNALEQDVRVRLRALVREVVRTNGIPTVFVTHDRDELRALADRVLIADHGSIVRLTDLSDLLR
jgi:molybdate transport system ATP-binding protein